MVEIRTTPSPDTVYFEMNGTIPLSLIKEEDGKGFSLSTLALTPSVILPHEEKELHLGYYKPNQNQLKKPAIILLPITFGDYFTENLARYFADKGFIVLRFPSRNELRIFSDESKNLTHFQQILHDDILNVRKGLQWLKEQPEVDPSRIGIMGISLGAILTSLLIEVETDFQAAVLFLGGGNLPGIFRTSKERPIAGYRDRHIQKKLAKKTPTNEEWEIFLKEAHTALGKVDPLQYPSLLTPDRILMINGVFDTVIKRPYTKELWTHLGEPNLIYLPAGHYGSVLFFHYARLKALKHFEAFIGVSLTRESPPTEGN
jgi:hypothetical protein